MSDVPRAGVALVTGAGRNIGRQIALCLADHGFAVAINVRTTAHEGQSVVDEISQRQGEALLCLADVTDERAVHNMVAAVEKRWGRLDVLINNAAIRQETAFDQMSAEQWRTTLSVVLDGAFYCTRAALHLLRRSERASIVNIGGMTGHTGAARRAHVVTAKAGLAGFTRALAHDLAPDRITVNCVAPGLINTVRNPSSASAAPDHRRRNQPLLGRIGEVNDVAQAVAWLVGPSARFVTGQTIHVNGGAYLGG
jgi:3-oxoacyl-[acyl-carrier protein] reductase